MADDYDPAFSNRKREYPAWSFLLVGLLFGVGSAALILTGATDGWRRPYVPWFGAAFALLVVGQGVREWWRNGSPTARRVKSEEERAQDQEDEDRFAVGLAAYTGIGLVALMLGIFALAIFG